MYNMIKYNYICTHDEYEWFSSTLSIEKRNREHQPKGWYSLLYVLNDDDDEIMLDTMVLHILRGSLSAHFVGAKSHECCLAYADVFERVHDLSSISRPAEPLCSFSETRPFGAADIETMLWGGHMGRDYGSHQGSLVVHADIISPDDLRLLIAK
jgi:hypothetical protein